MVEKLIIENDSFRLFLIPVRTPSEEWINFRVRATRKSRGRYMRCRLAYSRFQTRLSENKSTQAFRNRDPDGLQEAIGLLETAIDTGLV